MIKNIIKSLFIPSHHRGQVIAFPLSKQLTDPHQETLSTRRYVMELLKTKGYTLKQDIEIGGYYFDLLIPDQHFLIYCSSKHPDDITNKTYIKRLQKAAHSSGNRLYVIYKCDFYKDLGGLLKRLKLAFY